MSINAEHKLFSINEMCSLSWTMNMAKKVGGALMLGTWQVQHFLGKNEPKSATKMLKKWRFASKQRKTQEN